MDSRATKELSISNLFDQFIEASTMKNVLSIHHKILEQAELNPCEFNAFFPRYKRAVTSNKQRKNWKAKALLSKIEKRAGHKCYSNTKSSLAIKVCDSLTNSSNDKVDDKTQQNYSNNNAMQSYNCLVIGSGPAGLRTAIELQLLGASKVCIVEKRSRFSRNNVLHLWPFVIDDLKSLGAKKFYGKFCAGSIDHISIRQLQLILLKVCLMVGCDFHDSCSYKSICPSSIKMKKKTDSEISSDSMNDLVCDKLSSESINNNQFLKVESSSQELDPTSLKEENNDSMTAEYYLGQGFYKSSRRTENEHTPNQSVISTAIESPPKRPDNLKGARAHFECESEDLEKELHSYEWDVIIGADGRRNTLCNFFPRKEFRGRLAIAITANFINRQTQAETSVPEISGLSFIYNQDMFNALAYDTNIELENICYYKDDTHYFVMTAKKRSLLERGVLIKDHATTHDLLSDNNVNKEALFQYAKDAAFWTTGLEPLDFALNHYGKEDCAMFDFTSMHAASNACKALRTYGGGLTLIGLAGDSLLEPFWPTGSGCARGFLSSFDAAWMCRQWAVNKCAVISYHNSGATRSARRSGDRSSADFTPRMVISPSTYDKMALSVMAERESIYRILAQTTSENLQQNYSHWTLNPHTRYPNLNRHLVMPTQVEHLLSGSQSRIASNTNGGNQVKSVHSENVRRVKSPISKVTRKSPKKLKSAGASPLASPKNIKNRSKSLSKYSSSRSSQDLDFVDSYIEFEESYRNIADSESDGITHYLNYKSRKSTLDDLFVPSLSGTLPSSNNLSRLEARRAKDIDDCLRQRRQKSKINFVRDQLLSQLRGENKGDKSPVLPGGNAVLFNEIKRLKEQQTAVGIRGESKPKDISGPLSLLNSMRRCASFAERVKSFESKLVQTNQDNQSSELNMSTPRTPIDNVRNLPQFATLQELMANNTTSKESDVKRSHIHVARLSKGDWNVRCWENRLKKSTNGHDLVSARQNFIKSTSVDGTRCSNKPKKQIDVFQDRIKEMADKLKISKDDTQNQPDGLTKNDSNKKVSSMNNASGRSRDWINHLKRELVKGSDENHKFQLTNPVLPSRQIKKLFQDEDDGDENGIDVNKHYDHLCINRPTNKYLSRGVYTSHLARNKSNSAISRVKNCLNVAPESKQAHSTALTSRGSSASSTISDISSQTGNSLSGNSSTHHRPKLSSIIDVNCARCKKFVSTSDRIALGLFTLHRVCLTCSNCSLTLRSNEIQHYLNQQAGGNKDQNFLCAICQPGMRADLMREADDRVAELKDIRDVSLRSREEFLHSKVNYSELYKSILPATEERVASIDNNDKVVPSPIQFTLPMKLVDNYDGRSLSQSKDLWSNSTSETVDSQALRVANRETIDGRELVTLILPASTTPGAGSDARHEDDDFHPLPERGMRSLEASPQLKRGAEQQHDLIDEEELHRILHLDSSQKCENQATRKSSDASSTVESSTDIDDDEERNESNTDNSGENGAESSASGDNFDRVRSSSDDSSSLDIPLDSSEEYDDDDDGDDEEEEEEEQENVDEMSRVMLTEQNVL